MSTRAETHRLAAREADGPTFDDRLPDLEEGRQRVRSRRVRPEIRAAIKQSFKQWDRLLRKLAKA